MFQMLKDGEIDLLSDVSYKSERTEYMSFPDLPMGSLACNQDSRSMRIKTNLT